MEGELGLLKICCCGGMMKRIRKYENEAGAKFHTYQCSRCRGKVDYAQVDYGGVKGEFSVHSNIKIKETKMEDPKTSEGTASNHEITGEDVEVKVDGRKEPRLTQVNVNIWLADGHYLASFNHNPRRVFHNMKELLRAIEVLVILL